jgi:stage V sporulation protein R
MTQLGFYNTNLPPHLRVLKDEIEGYARAYGLDFYETIFEVVDADDLNEIAAYGGFPTRYPHWSFGMQYEELSKSYSYGLSKIYEMVINNDPCYAYLMRCNHTVDQKLVMAHVYGHCDFFKNNAYFGHTTRKMMDEIANHGNRLRRYAERFGEDEVEAFLDRCMSIDDLIDIHSVAIKRRDDPHAHAASTGDEEEDDDKPVRFKTKDYLADFMNPPDQYRAAEDEKRRAKSRQTPPQFPERPEKDVLLFLIEHAPLKNWQRDVLSIIRDEAYYFYPQAQTKIINEGWACLAAGSYVPTDRGMLDIAEIATERHSLSVSDGEARQRVVDWAVLPNRETIAIQTRRGLTLHGSVTHRIIDGNGNWKRLDELEVGDRLRVAKGTGIWAKRPVEIDWRPAERLTAEEICQRANVSMRTLYRHLDGRLVRSAAVLEPLVERHRDELSAQGQTMVRKRSRVRVPSRVDESFASFLGYLVGDGHISARKRTIGLTTGDDSQAEHFAELARSIFGVKPVRKRDGNKWRLSFSSRTVQDFLVFLGLKTGASARIKTVPDCVLRSPKSVVAAFLRALYDCDGYAGPAGVILSTSSETMSDRVQVILLNFGILSSRRIHKDGCWHVHTTGESARVFQREIGFGLERKRIRLADYIDDRLWFEEESDTDEIVAIERGLADVYDFTVERTHRYVASGFVNHNSFWHSTIMTQKVLQPSEVIDYADHHSGTMATSGKRLNPYKLGIELLRDIERRWNMGQFGAEWENCDDHERKRNWNTNAGLGREKIFEVRKIHNDITFIDTFLTPEFCVENKLFSFNYQNQSKNYVVESREFDKVKQRLLFSLTNFGKPWIHVLNGNHANRGELLLKHGYNGVELKVPEARDVLANIQYIWGRPVHLETVIDDKPALLSFDGTEHSHQIIGGDHDTRGKGPARTK